MSSVSPDRVLAALRRAREQLELLERRRREPIAIVGIGCRFPGDARDPDAFWQLLTSGVEVTAEFPAERFDLERYYHPEPGRPGCISFRRGAFLRDVDRFDAGYFGISPREARDLDPQHRLLLEVGVEALERAALSPDALRGSRTGVFVGITQNDYGSQFNRHADPARISTYSGTGNLFAFAAGRLSHHLGLRGPCLVVDTACSSSLVAVHLACQSLRSGESDVCVAGGVHLVLAPEANIFLSQSRAVSPDGRCRPFDAAANGFSRGEGCGVLVLRRLSDALAERHHVIAVIRGSSVNHDGESSGLTVPSEIAQQEVVTRALEDAGIDPARVGYVEAHGTGTRLGDPIEVGALRAALRGRRTDERPLWLGSVKANIGHLEAAAGVAGVIKAALAIEAGQLPPQTHFEEPNPLIAWEDPPVRVATRSTPFPEDGGERIAGVSAFGMSGTNAHVVLSTAPGLDTGEAPRGALLERTAYVLPVAARTALALDALAERHAEWLRSHHGDLASFCFTLAIGRAHSGRRRCYVATSADELVVSLTGEASAEPSTAARGERFEGSGRGAPRLGWLISALPPAFSPERVASALRDHPIYARGLDSASVTLQEAPEAGERTPLLGAEGSTVASLAAAFQHCLATQALVRALGLGPIAVSGIGGGRALAAQVAGVVPSGDAWLLARGGARRAVRREPARLPLVGCDDLWHPLGTEGGLAPEPVSEFHRALSALRAGGAEWVLCLGPGDVRLLGPDDSTPPPAPSPELAELELLRALARLYVEGATIDWSALHAGRALRRLTLPTYPFARERHWASVESAPARDDARTCGDAAALLLERELPLPGSTERRFELALDRTRTPWLEQHVIGSRVVAPGALLLASLLEAARECLGPAPLWLEDVRFVRPVFITEDSGIEAQIIAKPSGDELELEWLARPRRASASAWQLHATARARASADVVHLGRAPAANLEALARRCTREDSPERLRAALDSVGAHLGPVFHWHAALRRADSEVLCSLRPSSAAASPPELLIGLIDSCFQLLAVPAPESEPLSGVPAPVLVRRLRVAPVDIARGARWCHTPDATRGDFQVLDAEGRALIDAEGVTFHAVDSEHGFAPASAGGPLEQPRAPSLYRPAWIERAPLETTWASRDWLVICDSPSDIEPLLRGLQDRGDRVDTWRLADAGGAKGSSLVVAANELPARLAAWLQRRRAAGMIFLSGLRAELGRPAPAGVGTGAASHDDERLELAVERSCEAALMLMRALADPAAGLAPRLWIVTRGARAAGDGAPLPGLDRSALTGLSKVVPLEESRLRCTTIDLDPHGGELTPLEAAALLSELAHDAREGSVAYRGGRRLVERLVSEALPVAAREPRLVPDGTYLITGGLGGLGLALCELLVQRGARHCVLASRSLPNEAAEATLERLRTRGAVLTCARVDVSDALELSALLARVRRDMPPLRGVFHAAGVLDDALLRAQSSAALRRVLAPKLRGAWNLHELTRNDRLDHFVLLSSLASLCGAPGQGAYAAANAFLDGLAHDRHARGQCALSVNLGAIARVGMAARQGELERAQRARWGLHGMEPEAALAALWRVLGAGALPQAAIAAIDLPRWLAASSPFHGLPLWELLVPAPQTRHALGSLPKSVAPEGSATPLHLELGGLPPAARRARLLEHVSARVAQTLNLGSPEAVEGDLPLVELGMDSLMGVELAQRLGTDLGLRLPSTWIFDCPTARALALDLEPRLSKDASSTRPISGGDGAEPRLEPSEPPRESEAPTASGEWPKREWDALSDEELGALVDDMVARGV